MSYVGFCEPFVYGEDWSWSNFDSTFELGVMLFWHMLVFVYAHEPRARGGGRLEQCRGLARHVFGM